MKRLARLSCLSIATLAVSVQAQPQTADARILDADIEREVTELLAGYALDRYEGDSEGLKKAVHHDAARRTIANHYWGQPSDEWIRPLAYDLFDAAGGPQDFHKRIDPENGTNEVAVFDTASFTASAMLEMDRTIELVHAVEFEGEWVIADALVIDKGVTGEATEEDKAEIEQLIRDYVVGFYEIDGDKVQSTCHTGLSKRTVEHTQEGKVGFFRPITYEEIYLLAETFNRHFNFSPSARCEIDIYYADDKHAAAKVLAASWFDYFQIAKVEGEWTIVNIMFEGLPEDQWQR
ncbi:MAG: hypothetical protein Phyf2KO_03360 [Phycisphaerales bacterium]